MRQKTNTEKDAGKQEAAGTWDLLFPFAKRIGKCATRRSKGAAGAAQGEAPQTDLHELWMTAPEGRGGGLRGAGRMTASEGRGGGLRGAWGNDTDRSCCKWQALRNIFRRNFPKFQQWHRYQGRWQARQVHGTRPNSCELQPKVIKEIKAKQLCRTCLQLRLHQ